MPVESDSSGVFDSAAFREMTLTVLLEALDLADNLAMMSERVVQQVRALTGAKTVVLMQCLHESLGAGHRIVGLEPMRRRAMAESAEVDRLAELTHALACSVLWQPTGGGEATALLAKLECGLSIATPLRVGNVRLGCLLVLGLPEDEYGIRQVVQTLDMLSTVIALMFRTAILHETQEVTIAERTKELAEANEELRIEILQRGRTEERLRQSERELAVRNRIANVFLTVPDNQIYAEVLKIVLDATRSRLGIFGYIDEDGALVVPSMVGQVAEECQVPGWTGTFPRDTWGESIWPRAIRQKKTLYSNARSTQLPPGHLQIHRNISFPIVHWGEVIGLLQIANKDSDYDQEDILTVERIGATIAPILFARLQREQEERRREQSEASVKVERDRLQALMNGLSQTGIGVDIIGVDYKILALNDVLREKFGDPANVPCYSHYLGFNEPCEFCPMKIALTSGKVERVELSAIDGRYYELFSAPYPDQDGIVDKAIEVIVDITDRKAVEQEREKMIAKLEAQNAELERFTYTVSHDLRSPLITINGYVGMLRQDLAEGDSASVAQDLAGIAGAAEKMDKLLHDVLELSRIGRVVNPSENVPLGELAQEAIELSGGLAKSRNIRFNIATDLPVVFGDRVRLLEVLQNLIENAVKYMGGQPQPRIEIGWQRDGDTTVCWVRDNGIGIEPRYHEKVFGLFEQLQPTAGGTGIGLSLVKRIVEEHQGCIWVESDGLGAGSTFYFTLPLATPAETLEAEQRQ
ncbi:MAG: GAF domain-containing protein [Pirellulales bacterium]|nr:GAF domain-containing protein [Pirellulales bacterium]